MRDIISVVNWKGGVGKTTIVSNLAQGLVVLGKRVLVIDNDPQRNLTTTMGIPLRKITVGFADVLKSAPKDIEAVVAESIYETFMPGLDCIPGSPSLKSVKPRPTALKEVIATNAVKKLKYDYVLIDNPPSFGDRTDCIIGGSSHFLVPVQLRQYAIEGLVGLYKDLTLNYKIAPEKIMIVRNMYKNITSRKVASDSLPLHYKDCLLETIIPEDEVFENILRGREAKSIFLSQTKSRGTLAFQNLIAEIFFDDPSTTVALFEKKQKEHKLDVSRENLERAKQTFSNKMEV